MKLQKWTQSTQLGFFSSSEELQESIINSMLGSQLYDAWL